jgi:hypothetical protein
MPGGVLVKAESSIGMLGPVDNGHCGPIFEK